MQKSILLPDNSSEFLIFYTNSAQIYAINLLHVETVLIADKYKIERTPSSNDLITGVINYHNEIIDVIDFGYWINKLSTKKPKILLLCKFQNKKFALLLKEIIKIESELDDESIVLSNSDKKISYALYTTIKDKKETSFVFDIETLLSEAKND